MKTPFERKYNEYVRNIHSILSDEMNNIDHAPFVNQFLDRLEYINRNFTILAAEEEDVFAYQNYLGKLSQYSSESLAWMENYAEENPEGIKNMEALKENLFMLNDMFSTSQNLIKSFYPVI